MADISKIKLPNGNQYDLKDSLARYGRIHVVIGTQTAKTSAWTGNIDVDELYDGLTILYYLPYASGSAKVTINLTLKDGTTTGAVKAYITGDSDFTTAYAAGSAILFTYWSAGSISIAGTPTAINTWRRADYYISNTNTIGEYAGSCIAGPNGMARYSLIMQVDETHWESLVLSSGTGTTKTKNSSGFLLNSPILYQSAGTYASGTAAGQSACWGLASFDTRYSTNGGSFSVAGNPFYLVGTINNEKFYLATTWWASALPATDDGNIYIYIGQMYSAYQCTLQSHHPIYDYINGKWTEIFIGDSSTVNTHTVEADVPSDAIFTDTTYSLATTSSDGLMSAADKLKLSMIGGSYDSTTETIFLNLNESQIDTYISDANFSDALLTCLRNIAWTNDQGQTYYDTMYCALHGGLTSISVSYTQSNIVYDTDTLDSLKSDLIITGTYGDKTTGVINTYTLNGTLTVGTSTITINCFDITDTFTVNVTNSTHITAVYTDSVVYSDNSLDSLKKNLIVTYYENNLAPGVVLSDEDYMLSGTLTSGVTVITVTYNTLTTSFNARIIGVESYNYSSNLSEWNRSGTTVTYSDGKIYMHPANPNNWSCRATDPKKTLWNDIKHKLIRVRFSAYSPNWVGDFSNENPYNEVAFGVGVYSSKTYTGGSRLRYTDVANAVLTSTVQNFDAVFYTQYSQEENLTAENSFGGYIFAATSNEVYITDCKIQEITPYPVIPVLLNAVFNSPYVESGTTLSQLKSNLTVTSYNSDTTTSTVSDYTLSGNLSPGKNIITVSYNGLTTTFEVAVVSELFSGTYFTASNGNGVTIDRSPVRYHTDTTTGACVYGAASGSHSSIQRYSSAQISGITLYPFAIPSNATKLVFNSNNVSARVNILHWNTSSNDWECVSPDDWQSLVNAFNLSEYRTTYGDELYVIFSLDTNAISANKTNWFFGWA